MFPSFLSRAPSPLATIACSSTASSQQPVAVPPPPLPQALRLPPSSNKPPLTTTLVAAAAAGLLLLSQAPAPSRADPEFTVYYGTAASAANYGGYGGNASKKDTAEYVYDVPEGWKERLVSKVEKGTNGTDSEFFNPRKRTEKEYLTFLSGIRALAPLNAVLNNLALSDVVLQDQIATADDVRSAERRRRRRPGVLRVRGGGRRRAQPHLRHLRAEQAVRALRHRAQHRVDPRRGHAPPPAPVVQDHPARSPAAGH
ncbi:hypothetical protein U9M48_038343 [Paspalum notatum var. saurae]|uniref:Uncharacterized protein n=1 Tax=Paspalum notatum var. saurae TaxID=547442 RepID=A0AAQ3XAZ8_PASNO